MADPPLTATVPPGRWAVGVSGGADSVSLLILLRGQPDLTLHVVHLDHQARGGASTADAAFVTALSARLGVPATVARRSDVERGLGHPPANPPARYRRARLALFRQVVTTHGLDGVVLAHHADDQAETVLLRLLRGSGPSALAGMATWTSLDGLTLLRPLLHVGSADLRAFLRSRGQPWREDATNATDVSLRNRVRPLLASDPSLTAAARALGAAAGRLRDWLDGRSPHLGGTFAVAELQGVPRPVARHASARWLLARGAPADAVNRQTCDRLVLMATDAATAGRQTFPGRLDVRRAAGRIDCRQ